VTTAIVIVLVIWAAVSLYVLFFVGLPILFGADCDHAFLLILPLAIVLPFIWPLVLIYFGALRLYELATGKVVR
jgi:hypothetical protein